MLANPDEPFQLLGQLEESVAGVREAGYHVFVQALVLHAEEQLCEALVYGIYPLPHSSLYRLLLLLLDEHRVGGDQGVYLGLYAGYLLHKQGYDLLVGAGVKALEFGAFSLMAEDVRLEDGELADHAVAKDWLDLERSSVDCHIDRGIDLGVSCMMSIGEPRWRYLLLLILGEMDVVSVLNWVHDPLFDRGGGGEALFS